MATQPSAEIPHVQGDYEVVPGTVYLVDLFKNVTGVAHAGGKAEQIILISQPSEDPLDPLVYICIARLHVSNSY
jgi:hypothetical protein